VDGGDWTNVAFDNTSDMATGNYNSASDQADENSPQEHAFLLAEPYSTRIADAFASFHTRLLRDHVGVPKPRHFILTQAMNSYLQQQRGSGADIFNSIRDAVFKPLNMSQGSLSMLRTDNSSSGSPLGATDCFSFRMTSPKSAAFSTTAAA